MSSSSSPSSRPSPRLFFVIGPSGAGKSTLINGARTLLYGADDIEEVDNKASHTNPRSNVVFAHRYVSGPADNLSLADRDDDLPLPKAEFDTRWAHAAFALHWDRGSVRYGVGMEADLWMRAGLSVVVNGARRAVAQAVGAFGDKLVPVLVEADLDVLEKRLKARGREAPEQIAERLSDAKKYSRVQSDRLIRINNNGAPETAIQTFVNLLTGQ